MKKITLAMVDYDVTQGLEILRDLGVLHVEPVNGLDSKDTEHVKGQIDTLERALTILASRKMHESVKLTSSAVSKANQINSLQEKKDQAEARLQLITKEMERIKPLGPFSPSDLEDLKQNGLHVKIYRCHRKKPDLETLPVQHAVVGSRGSAIYLLAVSDEAFSLPYEEMTIPSKSLDALEKECRDLKETMADLDRQLEHHTAFTAELKRALTSHRDKLEFAQVMAGLGRNETIRYLQGYTPIDDLNALKQRAQDMGWGLLIEDPPDENMVPTLIKNPAWIRIIKPVLDFMGTLPGYKEVDVSFMFLVSLSLFFAMIVGDGGYGLLFLLAAFILKRRFKTAPKGLFILFYVFSLSTVVWGLISGTWFGMERLSKIPFLSRFVISDLNSYTDNQNFMIELCFTMGGVHLTVAHVIRAIRNIKSLKVFGDIGWIAILWSLYFVAGYFVLGKTLPDFALYLLLIGFFLAGVFSNPSRHVIKSSLLGFADLPLKVIGSFSDLVSYLRLFAVGYATLVVAVSFNQMAAGFGGHPLFRMFLATGVLFLGHAVNIIMALMGVLVHGIRLNMLEFSTHLGMNWTGREYRPFKRRVH